MDKFANYEEKRGATLMESNFNLEKLIDFIAAFFKRLLDNFDEMSKFANKFLGTEE